MVTHVVWVAPSASSVCPVLAAQTLEPYLSGFAVSIRLAANNALCVISGLGLLQLLQPRRSSNRLWWRFTFADIFRCFVVFLVQVAYMAKMSK